jgi:hypothetical protein
MVYDDGFFSEIPSFARDPYSCHMPWAIHANLRDH